MRSLRSVVTLVLVLAGARQAAAAPPAGVSEEDQAEGKRLFDEGLLRYDTAEYEQAITLFRAAYEKTRAPALLFNMAQAYRLENDCHKAADLYRQFIRLDPGSPDVERARSRLTALEPCPVAVAPLPAAAAPQLPGLLAVRASPAEPPGQARRVRFRTAGVVLAGVAVTLGTTAAVFGRRASNDADEVSAYFAHGGPWTAHLADVDADGRRAQQTATALLVSAGIAALLGAGAYLYGLR
jgi:tetratricopeptide (TPR) repeat protein